MGNSKSSYKNKFLYCNLLIFALLIGVYCYLTRDVKEGIRNMNCCGGIEAGVHYSETDRKPPDYVKQCFKSRNENGQTVYDWNGFPCTGNDSSDCCTDGSKKGECIATSKGGYCKSDNSDDFIFRRRESTSSSYIKRTDDKVLDINDPKDMQKYFFNKNDASNKAQLSPEMKRFMARRSRNEKFVSDSISSKASSRRELIESTKERNMDKQKNSQIIYTITLIHLIVLIMILIVVKDKVIFKIQGYLDVVNTQYLKFSGKLV